jgi:DNA-binding transcriptional regulator YhcF (GntR family)
MKRGLAGTLGGSPVTIDRPYNGLRRRKRVITMRGDGLCIRSVYRNPVKFSLLRRADDFVVAERRGVDFLLSAEATESEWLACVALSWSGVLLSNSIFRGA